MLTFRLLVVLGVSCLLEPTEAQVAPQCAVSKFDRPRNMDPRGSTSSSEMLTMSVDNMCGSVFAAATILQPD